MVGWSPTGSQGVHWSITARIRPRSLGLRQPCLFPSLLRAQDHETKLCGETKPALGIMLIPKLPSSALYRSSRTPSRLCLTRKKLGMRRKRSIHASEAAIIPLAEYASTLRSLLTSRGSEKQLRRQSQRRYAPPSPRFVWGCWWVFAGGVPIHAETGAQILLGDVIISTGLVQFDLGRQSPNQFRRKDTLQDEYGRPNADLRVFLRRIQGRLGRNKLRAAIPGYIAKICSEDDCKQWGYPGSEHDLLYETTYRHKHQTAGVCAICDRCTTDTDPVCDVAIRADCTQLRCDESHSVSRGRTGGQIGKASSADEAPPRGPETCHSFWSRRVGRHGHGIRGAS